MKHIKGILFIASFLLICSACGCNMPSEAEILETACYQTEKLADKFAGGDKSPRSFKNGKYKMAVPEDWTSGFFPGTLWQLYAMTGNEYFREEAADYTANLYDIRNYKGTHDLGFMIFCSYGKQYEILQDTTAANIIIETAESLISRYDETIGLIRSWDFEQWNYPVIIDNMMNLEMLFWASKYTGDPKYADIAVSHADRTMENHFREDYSSYHVVSYNNDGTVESKGTFQGQADDSSWARGQAWGLYGYTMCYRETKDERYKAQAEHIADYIMENSDGYVPYWDYDAFDIPDAPRDASAAAVTASALLELSTYAKKEKYFDYAENILKELTSDEYLAKKDDNGYFIIKHCVGNLPAGNEIDVPLNYGDYYFLEALRRYEKIKG